MILNRESLISMSLHLLMVVSRWSLGSKPMQGLNVFMQGYNESRSDGQSSGLDQSQLVNFAVISLNITAHGISLW